MRSSLLCAVRELEGVKNVKIMKQDFDLETFGFNFKSKKEEKQKMFSISDNRNKCRKFDELKVYEGFIPVGQSAFHIKISLGSAAKITNATMELIPNINPALAITPVNYNLAITLED